MSDNNTTINVQPVLDLQSLHKQLNSQKFKINVDIDTSALSSQVQASIGQFTSNMQLAKIPVEADNSNLLSAINTISNITTSLSFLPDAKKYISKSLD